MAVKAQRDAGNLRERGNIAPSAALALGVAEHPVGTLVRAAMRAVLAGKGLACADRFQHAYTAVCPCIALAAAHAIGADFLLCNIVLVALHSPGRVMRRVLLRLAVEQALGTFVHDAAVPVGLANHLFTPCCEMLAGERRIFSFCHNFLLNIKGNSHSPSPVSVLSFSSRPCSCASTSFILSGMGRPIWAAFSSRDRPSLDR